LSEPRKVRVSQNPSQEIEVSESEYRDLVHQGLIVNAKGEPAKATAPAAEKKKES